MTETAKLDAKTLEHRTSHRLYWEPGHNDLADAAADQLSGRSHYYDASTRRYFGCRVNGLCVRLEGLLLCTLESVSPPEGGRVHRAVVHDLTGQIIYRSREDEKNVHGFRTGKQANADLCRWLAEYHDEETEAARVLEHELQKARHNLARLDGTA
jgi:hypothetical protein